MKVHKGKTPDANKTIYILLDNHFLPVEPVQKYIHYLDNIQRSPNTIKTYIHNLKLYWEFLDDKKIDWKAIKLESLAEFIHWLRNPTGDVISLQEITSKRSEKTIKVTALEINYCSIYYIKQA